ncbi:MAG: ATP-dependent helicase [Lachnospiraceae bacterium]|nr:ATP-dependent helicase [Lachnospiraceae bacterium]MBR1651294.1 ATP-dependent helicase [Lachnospiraceae bacterium]
MDQDRENRLEEEMEAELERAMQLRERMEELYADTFERLCNRKNPANMKKLDKKINSTGNVVKNAYYGYQYSDLYPRILAMKASISLQPPAQRRKSEEEMDRLINIVAQKDWEILALTRSDDAIESYLDFLQDPQNRHIITKAIPVEDKFKKFYDRKIKAQIMGLVQTDPTAEYVETRAMVRSFHLHVGPTNSGKTYEAITKLKDAQKGVYLSPLRLLALEVYDTLNDAGTPTSMKTGEEHITVEDSRVISQTVETLNLDEDYDIAVIDECQMIADPERGAAWSRAILGVKAKEVYLLSSDNVTELLTEIIETCGDTYDITRHERKTGLVVEDAPFVLSDSNRVTRNQIRPGDCYILFSKKRVLDLAARFEMMGVKASVIYGKLPPETRKSEVRRFATGETKIVISTDAIGMGINLPIQRIIFAESWKFDGQQRRDLKADEILQIAGRAGRFGKYDIGYVTTTDPEFLPVLKNTIGKPLPQIKSAILGFPRMLVNLDATLSEILTVWFGIRPQKPYEKMKIDRMLTLYHTLKDQSLDFDLIYGDTDNKKDVIYDMISCPIDDGNPRVLAQWVHYCLTYAADVSLEKPSYPRGNNDLERLETYYKLLELYHLFSVHMGKIMDEDWLMEEKKSTELAIEDYLSGNKNKFIKRCKDCGRQLPVGHGFERCDSCRKTFEAMRGIPGARLREAAKGSRSRSKGRSGRRR